MVPFSIIFVGEFCVNISIPPIENSFHKGPSCKNMESHQEAFLVACTISKLLKLFYRMQRHLCILA